MPKREAIEKAVRDKYNLTADQVLLHKAGGFWYWAGDICVLGPDMCTYYTNLNDVSLERWLEDFEDSFGDLLRSEARQRLTV